MTDFSRSRKILIIAVIGVLLSLNIWRWLFNEQQEGQVEVLHQHAYYNEKLEFRPRLDPSVDTKGIKRNIFEEKIEIITTRNMQSAPRPVVSEQSATPIKSAEELMRESVLLELSEYKCVGISVHKGVIQAFLVREGQNFVAPKGARVGGRFVVTDIDMEKVTMVDDVTGTIGVIKMTGAK